MAAAFRRETPGFPWVLQAFFERFFAALVPPYSSSIWYREDKCALGGGKKMTDNEIVKMYFVEINEMFTKLNIRSLW